MTWAERYAGALMNTFGPPRLVLTRGEGCRVWDDAGGSYLDLLGGIAVNSLGHGHPAVVEAVTRQLQTLDHVSNFCASEPQIRLAERLLALAGQPREGRGVFTNAGTEANEDARKVRRRSGRTHGVDAGPLSPSLKVGTGLGIPSQPAVLISSAEDSPAKTSVSRGSDAVLPGSGRDSSLSSPESQMNFSLDGLSSRTFPDSSLPPVDEISESFSRPWSTSGMAWVGGASMLDTSEWPSDAVECSLSDVLVANPDQRYALSARAAKGILRRAAARGRTLPASLHEALTVLASSGR